MRSILSVALMLFWSAATGAAQSVQAAPTPVTAPRQQGVVPVGSARSAPDPLARLVTVSVTNAPIAEVIRSIDEQATLGLAYSDQVLPAGKRVTINVRNATAKAALEKVLAGTGVVVRTSSLGTLVLMKAKKTHAADEAMADTAYGTVWGQVTDSASTRPLVDAIVGVKGTSLSFRTNPEGQYLLTHLPAGLRVITVRQFGYSPMERDVVVIDSQVVRVDFALKMGMSRLQEVVTTASGPQRRLELGSDITVINADSITATQPITSVTDLLEGRVPGLVVEHSSGAPGDPARLILRGSSSAHLSNDPIVIVDGVRLYSPQSKGGNINLATANFAAPSPLDYLDPHSIETIEVLKGPSAATLYGADAANGVIVITMKRGRSGPPRWTTSVERGTTSMPGSFTPGILRWGHRLGGGPPQPCAISDLSCVGDSVVRFQSLNDPELTILGHGQRTSVMLGVSGGSDALQYSVNANYGKELGLIQLPGLELQRFSALHDGASAPSWMRDPQSLEQWNVTSGVTAMLGRTADVRLTTTLGRTNQQRSSLEQQTTSLMGTYIDRASGTYYRANRLTSNAGSGASMSVIDPTYALGDYFENVTDNATSFLNGVNLNWRPRAWLTTSADAGINVVERNDGLLLPRGLVTATDVGTSSFVSADSVGRASSGRGSSLMKTVNLQATAIAPLPRGLRLETSIGANYADQSSSALTASASDLPLGSSSLAGAGEIKSFDDQRQEFATFGWYVEPKIASRRLWISTGLRFDGGTSFGSHVGLAGFPKVSVSYLISDEPFFPFKSVFTSLRLRAAYGHAGVQPGPGDRLRLYSAPTSTWIDGRFTDGVTLSTLGNPDLKPERSTELEGGFDTDLFGDRFSLGVSGYRKNRVDAIMAVPLPPSVYGFASILRNIGEIRNSGYDLTLGAQLVRSDPVTWSAQLQVSHHTNIVTKLGRGVEPFGDNDAYVAQGYPLFGRWGRPVLGFSDQNQDSFLQANEVLYGDTAVFLGPSEPNYTASLYTTLSLFRGEISVSAGFTYNDGSSVVGPWNSLWAVSPGVNDPRASLAEQAAALSASTTDASAGYFLNTQIVHTVRFNSLSVAYNVPSHVVQRLGARALTISLQGSNLGLRTNYRGLDPDVGYGMDAGQLPQPRTWQVRVSAGY